MFHSVQDSEPYVAIGIISQIGNILVESQKGVNTV